MTLLEMIKKWEGVKDNLEKQRLPGTRIEGDIDVADDILKDLKSIRDQQPSWVTIRVKVLTQINKAINNDDPDGAYTWTQVLSMLPS